MTNLVVYDKGWAEEITVRIQRSGEEFGELLFEAHEGKAWKFLGFKSWTGYVEEKFPFTRQHSYRLLEQEKVNRALKDGGSEVRVTGREARELSPAGDSSATIHVGEVEQKIYERRSGPVPKPAGKKRRGFQPPDELVRRDVERYQGWYEQMEPGQPVSPQFIKTLERLRDVVDAMIVAAEDAGQSEQTEEPW